jgi:hypothetical protein
MRFEPNVPVELREPSVVVDAGLPPGQHRFQLVVVNLRGKHSKPLEVIVTVERITPFPQPTPRPRPEPRPTPISGPLRPPIR